MRKVILVSILLLALSMLGVVRVPSSAVADESKHGLFAVASNGMNGRTTPDGGGARRTMGLWLLAMTGTAVVLRPRSSHGIR